MKIGSPPIDWRSALRVAVLADADPKTVLRVLEDKPTRPSVRQRIMAALLECGLVPAAPASPSDASQASPEKPENP
jgi:DNA-binding LacI/PurR family transcriptional regulator